MTGPEHPKTAENEPPPPERVSVLLRLPADLVGAADVLADEQSVSRSALLVAAISYAVEHPSRWIDAVKDGRALRWEREREKQAKPAKQERSRKN